MKQYYYLIGFIILFMPVISQTAFGVHWGNAIQGTPMATITSVKNQLQLNNVKWIRTEISWHDIDTAQGAPYKWAQLKNNVDSLKAWGFNIIGMLKGTPKWYTTNTSTISANDAYYAPLDTIHWVRFIDSALNKFNGKITHWEIWNEEDGFYFIAPQNTKARKYFYILRSGYNKIKTLHPADKILVGGFTSRMITDRKSFADSLFLGPMQAQNYFDFMNFHIYEKAASYKNYLLTANINKPIWITETNPWKVLAANGGNSEINTANYLCNWIKDTLINNFNPTTICWFNLRNWVTQNQIGVCDNCNPDSTAYGLFNSLYNPTAILPAYKNCLGALTELKENVGIQNSYTIFPNPVTDKLFIKNLITDQTNEFVVYNAVGIEVCRKRGTNEDIQIIDCSLWPNGLYMILSKVDGANVKKRFIKAQ